ncbi:MAG: restriction endonuclease subunit S [Flavobacteriales bacterium]
MMNPAIEIEAPSTSGADLPKGWRWTSLSEVTDNLDNKRKPINSREREKRQGDVPYYGATGQVGWIDKHLLDEELVLVGEDGAPFLDSGKAKAYMIRGRSWVNNHAHVLRAKDGMPNEYLMHYLNILDYSPFVSGTTRLKLTKGAMSKIPVPVAPLPEQLRIVAAIETQLGRLDAAVARLHAAKAQLKRYKQAVLKAAVEGPLQNGGDCKWISIEEASERIVDCLHSTPKFTEHGKYCIDTTCIEQGVIRFDKARFVTEDSFTERIRRLKPEAGDILFAREGTVGTTVMVPEDVDLCLGQRMMMFRLKKTVLPEFFMYVMQSPIMVDKYQPLIMGTTAPHLNIRDIKKFTFPKYPLNLQEQIVDQLEMQLGGLRDLESALDAQLLHSTRLRQSVLKRAFEGRLV